MRDVCLPLAAQRGQALIESVLLLSLLTLLLHAALGLGRAQLAAMQLGNSSRKAAATAARGQAMSMHDVRNGVALRGVAQVARGGSASAASQSLRNDWLGEARLVQVRADTTVAMPPPFSGCASVARSRC